jgi:hypothetical protein
MKTVAYESDGELAILVHGPKPPTDEDWNGYLAFARAGLLTARNPRCLVLSGATVPSPKQRAELNKLVELHKAPVPTAVVTSSLAARGIVTVFGWFNSAIRAFRMDELAEALDYLGVERARFAEINVRIRRLRVEVGW